MHACLTAADHSQPKHNSPAAILLKVCGALRLAFELAVEPISDRNGRREQVRGLVVKVATMGSRRFEQVAIPDADCKAVQPQNIP